MIPFVFHTFSNYDCHLVFEKLVDKKNDKVKYKIIPKTYEEYISVSYGCIIFIDKYRFLSYSLDNLVENLDTDGFINLKNEFPDKWENLNKQLAYTYEDFNTIDDYQKPVNDLKKEDFFNKLTNDYADDSEIERTIQIIKFFDTTNGEQLTKLYMKTYIILLADVFEELINVSIKEVGINHLYCVSSPAYTYQGALKYSDMKLQTLQDEEMILLKKNYFRGGISSIMGDGYVKSDVNKKMLYIDATNLYGYLTSEPLPLDKIEMWHGHPDFYMDKLEEILNTSDDSDIGYFLEVASRYPNQLKKFPKNFAFCRENKVFF